MSAIGWQGRLNEAPTVDDVATVCREYVDLFSPASLAELPASCLPKPRIEVREISPYALSLIRELGLGDRASAPALHEITTFFIKAALRLAQITTQIAAVSAEQRQRSSD
jgi:hypothetical protein